MTFSFETFNKRIRLRLFVLENGRQEQKIRNREAESQCSRPF
jgi:hypothetical protein